MARLARSSIALALLVGCGGKPEPAVEANELAVTPPSAPAPAPAPAPDLDPTARWCVEVAPLAEVERIVGLDGLQGGARYQLPPGVAACEYKKQVMIPNRTAMRIEIEVGVQVDCRDPLSVELVRETLRRTEHADATSYRDLALGAGGGVIAGKRPMGEQTSPFRNFMLRHDRLPCTVSGGTSAADVDVADALARLVFTRLTEANRPR
jgi:hypothetical protein